jgi:hypothetical protein
VLLHLIRETIVLFSDFWHLSCFAQWSADGKKLLFPALVKLPLNFWCIDTYKQRRKWMQKCSGCDVSSARSTKRSSGFLHSFPPMWVRHFWFPPIGERLGSSPIGQWLKFLGIYCWKSAIFGSTITCTLNMFKRWTIQVPMSPCTKNRQFFVQKSSDFIAIKFTSEKLENPRIGTAF